MSARRLAQLGADLPALRWVDETASTNADARAWAEAGAPHGAAVLAGRQTAGRGRLGRRWESADGAVLLSIVLRPPLALRDAPLLCLGAAVAAAEVGGPELRIKWPNDVLAPDGGKVAGILAEVQGEGSRLSYAVLGIGMNVGSTPRDIAEARALRGDRDPLEVGVALVRAVLHTTRELVLSPDAVLGRWRARSATLGHRVRVGGVEGEAVDLDPDGALRIRVEDGSLRRVVAGDVEMVGRC